MEAKYTYCTKMHKDVIQNFLFHSLISFESFSPSHFLKLALPLSGPLLRL